MKSLINIYLKVVAIALVFALPVCSQAKSDQLWTKVRGIVMYDKTIAFSLTDQEFNELKSLADSGDANAQYGLGVVYLARQNFRDAKTYLQLAANQGHQPAMNRYQQYFEMHLH